MEKNEIISRWLDVHQAMHMDYNTLHEAWVKFRDLKVETYPDTWQHKAFKTRILDKIAYNTITEAFDELVKGIEWYNSIK